MRSDVSRVSCKTETSFHIETNQYLLESFLLFMLVLGFLTPVIFGYNSIGNSNAHMAFFMNMKDCNCHFIVDTIQVRMKKIANYHWRPTLRSVKISDNALYDEKCFSCHVKSFSRSSDIYIFVLTFWSCRKTAWYESYG